MASVASDPEVAELYAAVPEVVVETLLATVRELSHVAPAPRDDPFYGLDRQGGPGVRLLERLTRHGDFRKYVFVLDVGAGLGGGARWLAARYGCRVVALDVCPSRVAAARRLTARARLDDRVRGLVGSFDAVPIRTGAFTQIWSVETLHHARDRRRALAELFRVLRPGSPVALHEVVRRDASVPVIGGAWRHGTADEYVDAMMGAGFTDVRCEDVTAEPSESSPLGVAAEAGFERLLAPRLPADAPWRRAVARRAAVGAAVAGPEYRTVQLFARRPSR